MAASSVVAVFGEDDLVDQRVDARVGDAGIVRELFSSVAEPEPQKKRCSLPGDIDWPSLRVDHVEIARAQRG